MKIADKNSLNPVQTLLLLDKSQFPFSYELLQQFSPLCEWKLPTYCMEYCSVIKQIVAPGWPT